ncbi:MAG: hypothetical protein IPK53_09315 [bacterium]|nr:hypothetical protein [bacterium]
MTNPFTQPAVSAATLRVRIASQVGQSRLHVEDSLKYGKIRLAGNYREA